MYGFPVPFSLVRFEMGIYRTGWSTVSILLTLQVKSYICKINVNSFCNRKQRFFNSAEMKIKRMDIH
jgi:hypothetical protein